MVIVFFLLQFLLVFQVSHSWPIHYNCFTISYNPFHLISFPKKKKIPLQKCTAGDKSISHESSLKYFTELQLNGGSTESRLYASDRHLLEYKHQYFS